MNPVPLRRPRARLRTQSAGEQLQLAKPAGPVSLPKNVLPTGFGSGRCGCRRLLLLDVEAWYRARHRQVYRFLLSRGRQPADADDVVQEVFRELLVRGVRELDSPGAWLMRAAVLKASSVPADLLLGDEQVALVLGGSRRVTWTSMSAPYDPEAAERFRRVLTAMAQLPDKKRAVAALIACGWTYDEIAEHLGIAAGTVAAHLHHAREQLNTPAQAKASRARCKQAVDPFVGVRALDDELDEQAPAESVAVGDVPWVWCPVCEPGTDPHRWSGPPTAGHPDRRAPYRPVPAVVWRAPS